MTNDDSNNSEKNQSKSVLPTQGQQPHTLKQTQISDIFIKLGIDIDISTFNRLFVNPSSPTSNQWDCSICTFKNNPSSTHCSICCAPKTVKQYCPLTLPSI